VEEFGKALLRGLGWDEGQGIGRKRQLVEAKQGVRRPERLGLGAAPAAPAPAESKRPRKMGELGFGASRRGGRLGGGGTAGGALLESSDA
jgi:hypothetical protein